MQLYEERIKIASPVNLFPISTTLIPVMVCSLCQNKELNF